ncbi:MAG: GrpB family protein [Patescibacteria group bacterium]
MPKHNYSQRSYTIVPYDLSWPMAFEKIREAIAPVFGNIAERIEHVGSTSIPDMAGKPTIDVLVIVKDISAVDALNLKMAELGYKALGEYVAPGGRLFVLEENGDRLVNIHCFQPDHRKTRRFLSLRDYLRSHQEELKAYAELKLDLYRRYPSDYGAYRQEKDAYMKDLDDRAEKWRSSHEL